MSEGLDTEQSDIRWRISSAAQLVSQNVTRMQDDIFVNELYISKMRSSNIEK